MKLIKIYIGVATTLLVIAIGLGIYVWYTIQKLNADIDTVHDTVPTTSTVLP